MARYEESFGSFADSGDFVRRKRHGNIVTIGLLYVFALVILILGHSHKSWFGGDTGFLTAVVVLFGVLSAYALYAIQRHIDMITEVEFQNALFSSAITKRHHFTLITRHDGSFAFVDEGFKKTFPEVARRSNRGLNELVDAIGLAKSDAEQLYQAMSNGKAEYFLFSLVNEKGATIPMHLSVVPLDRPKGFFLIHSREYITRRGEVHAQGKEGEIPEIYVRYMLDGLPFGVYVASSGGRLRITSRVLEAMLGYQVGEMAKKGMEVSELLYQVDGKDHSRFASHDFHDEVMFAHKNGSLVRANLLQKVLFDDHDNIIATIGVAEPL